MEFPSGFRVNNNPTACDRHGWMDHGFIDSYGDRHGTGRPRAWTLKMDPHNRSRAAGMPAIFSFSVYHHRWRLARLHSGGTSELYRTYSARSR